MNTEMKETIQAMIGDDITNSKVPSSLEGADEKTSQLIKEVKQYLL